MALRLVAPPPPQAKLPTTWEETGDHTITWSQWRAPHISFICPPGPPDPCPGCGLAMPEEIAEGRVQPLPGDTVGVGRNRRPAWPWIRLLAFRCTGCHHLSVFDEVTRQLWYLEADG
jgi:hypothetical protein